MSTAGLYGIELSNRSGDDLWGKNQFNSTFPAALCCYMRSQGHFPVYLSLGERGIVSASDKEVSFDDVFNAREESRHINFMFEHGFLPYANFVKGGLEHTDMVIVVEGQYRRALENKLTVLPDSSTVDEDPSLWGCELVIRPASVSYACLGIYHSLVRSGEVAEGLTDLTESHDSVGDWGDGNQVLSNAEQMLGAVRKFLEGNRKLQIPFLVQPIWKTKGLTPELDENAFDVFVWSNFALLGAAVDRAEGDLRKMRESGRISRSMRSCVKVLRTLHDLFQRGKVDLVDIYTNMSHGNQTDKEFALNGKITRNYMSHPRLKTPVVKSSERDSIILGGGAGLLKPERRLDALLYYEHKYGKRP
jgi:hypothetical protein